MTRAEFDTLADVWQGKLMDYFAARCNGRATTAELDEINTAATEARFALRDAAIRVDVESAASIMERAASWMEIQLVGSPSAKGDSIRESMVNWINRNKPITAAAVMESGNGR